MNLGTPNTWAIPEMVSRRMEEEPCVSHYDSSSASIRSTEIKKSRIVRMDHFAVGVENSSTGRGRSREGKPFGNRVNSEAAHK